MVKYYILISLIFFTITQSLGQNSSDFTDVINSLIEYNIKDAQIALEKKPLPELKKILQWNINSLKYGIQDTSITGNKTITSYTYKTLSCLKNGDIYKHLSNINDSVVFDNYKKALVNAQRQKDTTLIRYSYHKILPFLLQNKELLYLLTTYTNDFKGYIQTTSDYAVYRYYSVIEDIYDNRNPHIKESLKVIKSLKNTNNRYLEGLYYQIIGVQKSAILKQPDSSIYYYKKAATSFEKVQGVLREKNTFAIYNNIAISLDEKESYQEALEYHRKAQSKSISENSYLQRSYHYQAIALTFRHLNMHDSAYHYLEKEKEEIAKLGEYTNAGKLQEIETKYKTAEKEKENLILSAQKKRNQNIAIGLGGFLFLGSIITFLVYRNTKRKQHIAEQDRELQIQKTEKVLKEKEIETINAMVSGQEKERLRLAGELHDNLGSTLATVRMQVENLERNLDKVDDPKELLQKTHSLVNEAYDKVRSISHERNSGVMAKDGLLPAVQKLARTVSNANSLTVDVQDFGLENRIPNELEITIFRVIQELVTNIIKHAHASEASISLTQHDNELNIMVEDNGKGFKVGKLQDKDGMGLGSIERRIEHLEGSMEVDSTIGRGTSVSIDIPL